MKKRMLAMLLCIAMVLSLLPMTALAADFDFNTIVSYAVEGGNIYFRPSIGTICDSDKTITEAVIPSEIDGEAVLYIGKNAFLNCSSLTSVTLPDSVTCIEEHAFSNCRNLTNVTFPERVTNQIGQIGIEYIGERAFSYCSSLTSVSLPDGATHLGKWAFSNCSSLTSVTIPDSISSLGSQAFEKCNSLTDIYYKGDIISWCELYFSYSDSNPMYYAENLYINGKLLEGNLIIPSEVTNIGPFQFLNCNKLTSVIIPDSTSIISSFAFMGCNGLTNVTIPSSVSKIDFDAFYDCSALENVYYAGDLTKWCEIVFSSDESNPMCYAENLYISGKLLEGNLIIPNEITNIGRYTFIGCSSLTSVTIPDSVTNIGYHAFRFCSNLSGIYYTGDMASWCKIVFDVPYLRNYALGYYVCNPMYYAKKLYVNNELVKESLTIPGSLTNVGDSTFEGCIDITCAIIPDGVTSIGNSAFYGCRNLSSVIIPGSITNIGFAAFYGCNRLTDIYYAGTEEEWNNISISDYNTCLTDATIHFNSTGPEDEGEDKDEEFTTRTEYHQLKGHDAFTNTVIFEDDISYKWAHEDDWADIMALVGKWVYCTIEHSEQSGDVLVKVVPGGACGDNLTWTLENGILTISGSGEMDNWDDYTNTNAPWYADYNDIIGVVIENGVTSIGSSAFIDLTDCKSFSIGADVQSIGKRAFSSLSSNTKIKFNGNAPSIDTSAFADDLDGIDIYYNSEKGDWEKVIAQEYESIPSIAWIYSEDATENLAIENTLRFPNEATYFGGEENGYYISKNDYQTLLSNLNSKDKKAIESKKNINGEKNVYFYNVDRGTSSHFTWGGSCYGMSVLIALVNGGILSLSDFNTSADTLFAVDSTAETQSIINFYQGQQLLPFVTGIQAEFMTQQEQPAQIKKMEELVTDAQANGSVALISFAYKDETGQATRRDHTILGYAVERGTFKLQINDTPYLFDRRILTYDPAYSGDHQQYHNGAIYYNDTQWAMIGLYNVVSSTNGFNLNSESDTAQLKLVITDTNYINAVDYVTGETNFNSVAKNAYLYTGNSDFIVESIWGVDTVKNGLFDGAATIADNGAVIIGMDADTGNSGTMPFTVAFPHLDSTYTVTTANDTVDFALAYENYYLSANSDQPGTVTFEPNGKVIMTTDQTGTGYLSITANDGCSSLPWHTLDIVSKDTSKLAFELTDTGILVAGDTLTDVTIYGTNDEETTELTFSTKAHSVLVASENNELVISEIPDKNSSSNSNNSTSSAFNPISISTSSNGTVSVNPKSAKAGNTVTITVVPDDGYGLDKLTVTDKNGSDIKLTDQGNGVYTFTMPDSEVFVTASFTELEHPTLVLPFTDVTTSDWFYDAVAYAYDNSLMTGTSATTFSPNATTTRGMIVTILHRLEGSPAAEASGFADVESGAWYQAAVDWAAANGIVSGTSQTTFAPTDPITREQMAAILYRYAAYKGYDVSQLADLSRFSDSSAVNTYAADALAWANAAGLITGVTNTTLSPQGSAVRAQAATILMRFCENIAQ